MNKKGGVHKFIAIDCQLVLVLFSGAPFGFFNGDDVSLCDDLLEVRVTSKDLTKIASPYFPIFALVASILEFATRSHKVDNRLTDDGLPTEVLLTLAMSPATLST